ncbi:hypothetical protein FNJ88_04010 [Chryseobacterium sp. SNU WT5]|uniref:hypothetical protein n=1 Tax=Chryseobacterium sp. SNU WT5 TaxID=2594269 RepID=UPI0011800889|nr:hypothetical protein [Chryseobacterium sp. SNU WT5]QDP84754.1 hypothetical protein FNJ88_04010 [Chryseobacterium sp. SNU WT5]
MKRINRNLGIPYAVGYILAGLVILPLIIFGANKLFFKGNDVDNYLNAYLQKSMQVKVKFDERPQTYRDYERYTAFLAKKHGGIIHVRTQTFYSTKYKKFFQLRMANVSDNFYAAFSNHIKKAGFIMTVNKDDMENSQMGTKSNPVPVFKVVGDEKPIELSTQSVDGKSTIYDNWDINDEEYENSVYVHLKYVMSKEEFKERFEKNK